MEAFQDHGMVAETLTQGVEEAHKLLTICGRRDRPTTCLTRWS